MESKGLRLEVNFITNVLSRYLNVLNLILSVIQLYNKISNKTTKVLLLLGLKIVQSLGVLKLFRAVALKIDF